MKINPLITSLLLVFCSVSLVTNGLFYKQSLQNAAELKDAKLKAANLQTSLYRVNLRLQEQGTAQNYSDQYAEFLQNELRIASCLHSNSDDFKVYQYGFQFAQSKDVPLSCEVDTSHIISYSPSGRGDVTVNCSLERNNPVSSKIATENNLITPITFTLLANYDVQPLTPSGVTSKGRKYYREVKTAVNSTVYEYSFYSSKPVNVFQTYSTGELSKYTLNLPVFAATDQKSLDVLASKIIDQVSFINLVEPSNSRCLQSYP